MLVPETMRAPAHYQPKPAIEGPGGHRYVAKDKLARAIVQCLVLARDADVLLFERMDDAVNEATGFRYQLPEFYPRLERMKELTS